MKEKQIEFAKLIIKAKGDCFGYCKKPLEYCPLDKEYGCDPIKNKRIFGIPNEISTYNTLYISAKLKWFEEWLSKNEEKQKEFDFT